MNECIVLLKYRHLVPHEVFFKTVSGTKKLGLRKRRKKTGRAREKREGRERASSFLASLSRPLVLSGAHITFMGLLRRRRKTLRVNSLKKQANFLRLLYFSGVYVVQFSISFNLCFSFVLGYFADEFDTKVKR